MQDRASAGMCYTTCEFFSPLRFQSYGMEPIAKRRFTNPVVQAIHDRAVEAVEADPDFFISRYRADARSMAGRYVCADLFKETFDDYKRDRESRYLANHAVHNASAVLASEQLRRVLAEPTAPGSDAVIFLTGIPGAGKTTTVHSITDRKEQGEVVHGPHAIYEGQLSRPAPAMPKIRAALEHGLVPTIFVVHPTPEAALQRALERCDRIGRGAPITVMADIQGGLSAGLATIRAEFGDDVGLHIVDSRGTIRQAYDGWHHLKLLDSEGNRERIYSRLDHALEDWHRQGRVSEAGYAQARGYEALAEHSFVAGSSVGSRQPSRHGQGDASTREGAELLSSNDHASAFALACSNPLVRAFLGAHDASSRSRAAVEYPVLVAAFAHDAAAEAFARDRLGSAASAFHAHFRQRIAVALHEGRKMPAPALAVAAEPDQASATRESGR